MSSLHPTVPFMVGESPASFVSRLASRNGIQSARAFCLDMGLTFQRVVDGCRSALTGVADLVGMPAQPLLDQAIQRIGKTYSWRDQTMVRPTLRRARLYGCPVCLHQDIVDGHAPGECASYGRSSWLLAPIRSCSVHGMALVEIARAGGAHDLHDFALLMRPRLEQLDAFAREAVPQPPSALETYLLGRLDGIADASPWLDGLEWHAAAKTCEMIGAVATYGRTPNLNRMTDADWHRAGWAGFEIARQGDNAVREFLSELQRTYPYTRAATERPQAMFGRFYQWLAFGARDPAYDHVRELTARHIHETTPVGQGHLLFGKPVVRRILHSIRTASLETGAHPKRLRKILAAAGHLPEDHAARPNHQVLFSAEAAAETLRHAVRAISLREAETYLNAGRVHAKLLADAGFIRRFVPVSGKGAGRREFARDNLDAFMARLQKRAVSVDTFADPICDIPSAARGAHCRAMEIVQLILSDRLTWVGRKAGDRGYLSILVDCEEVKRHVHRPALDGLTPDAAQKVLGTTHRVMKALIAGGLLPTQRRIHPANRCPVDVIARKHVEAFHERYVSLIGLARERGSHFMALKRLLDARGIQPALPREVYGASFYERAILPD